MLKCVCCVRECECATCARACSYAVCVCVCTQHYAHFAWCARVRMLRSMSGKAHILSSSAVTIEFEKLCLSTNNMADSADRRLSAAVTAAEPDRAGAKNHHSVSIVQIRILTHAHTLTQAH